MEIEKTSLLRALSSMFGVNVSDAIFSVELLQGGTVGEVSKLSGEALTQEGHRPFELVMKNQRQWDRHGDPDCWRREYDLYKNGLDRELFPSIKLPRCYLLEEGDGVTRIWMEYVVGATGSTRLHATELALAAERLGELQADFHLNGQRDLTYLRGYPAVRSSFDLWMRRMNELFADREDGFPNELRHILNDYAARATQSLSSLDDLPLTLCQGDVHHDNLILKEGAAGPEVYLLDWDCAGYGRMGEDAVDILMEAFLYSDRDLSLLPSFRCRIIEGYCQGVRSQGVDFAMSDRLVREIFAYAWGFRIAAHYLHHKDEGHKQRCLAILSAMLNDE
ncbi:MAG: aminoglycoside phosphotransferase family protein [Bacillota bacterium]